MQPIQTREILFSFDEPRTILNDLQLLIQEIRRNATGRTALPTSLHARTILVIDADKMRANSIATVLSSSGYYPYIVPGTLEAFTSFLQGAFVPFLILLGQDNTNNRFFLSRLSQQVSQKYQWNTPIITIRTQFSTQITPNTEDLGRSSRSLSAITTRSEITRSSYSTQTTAPLPHKIEAPRELSSEVQRIKQEQFSSPQYTPQPSTSLAIVEPIINVSTHDLPHEPVTAMKITLEGTSIGRYHMKAFLGNGPLGQVYQTYDRLREQDVALKAVQMNALPSDISEEIDAETNFFQQELDLLRRINHPHILLPLNCGKSYISGSPFVYKTMPYIKDGSIAARLYELGGATLLAPQEVVLVASQIAETLQSLHALQITYQNFKLSNFLVQLQGKKKNVLHVYLTDFFIVHNKTYLVKAPDVFPYMAPECWSGQSLAASDQYGLAAITYELLTGRSPFQGQSEKIMRQLHLHMQPQPLTVSMPHLPPRLSHVVLHALSKRPEDRFPSVMDFASALQQSLR